jgi:hypothetical protein
MLLQEYNAKQACEEIGLINPKIKINHHKGETIINSKVYGLVFPRELINYCKSLWAERVNEFYFKGNISKNREWIEKYSNIYISNRGRDKNLKYSIDYEYYISLSRTKFSLSPVGECPWSYRFFESIACGAIPVLGDNDIDIFAKDYKFFRHSDKKEYNIEDANRNYETLLNKVLL